MVLGREKRRTFKPANVIHLVSPFPSVKSVLPRRRRRTTHRIGAPIWKSGRKGSLCSPRTRSFFLCAYHIMQDQQDRMSRVFWVLRYTHHLDAQQVVVPGVVTSGRKLSTAPTGPNGYDGRTASLPLSPWEGSRVPLCCHLGSFIRTYYLGGADSEQAFENVTCIMTCP